MDFYRVYFLNRDYKISHLKTFSSASDEEALNQAGALLETQSECANFELWQDRRAVKLVPRILSREAL